MPEPVARIPLTDPEPAPPLRRSTLYRPTATHLLAFAAGLASGIALTPRPEPADGMRVRYFDGKDAVELRASEIDVEPDGKVRVWEQGRPRPVHVHSVLIARVGE